MPQQVLVQRIRENKTCMFVCLLGCLNSILQTWLTISRGAEPHAQNPNSKTEKG